jgi:hypothetical protein
MLIILRIGGLKGESVRILGISLALASVLVTTAAQASQVTTAAQASQAKDVAALQSFRLTDDFLAKYQAVDDDSMKDPDPCHLVPLGLLKSGTGSGKSLDQMTAEYDAQPGVHAMLTRHGLTAREEVLGFMNLFLAAIEVAQEEHPDTVPTSGNIPISAANLAFFKSHKAAIQQHSTQLAQQALKANHGKLPACLSAQ